MSLLTSNMFSSDVRKPALMRQATTFVPAVLRRATAFVLVLLCSYAQQLPAQTFTCDVDQLWYSCDPTTHEAVVIACKNAQTDYVYDQANIYIPATISIGGASFGGGGSGSESENVYTVTEIGEGAFVDSWAQTFTFDAESKVRIIRRRGLYGLRIKNLALPATLRVIEEQGLYIKSSEKSKSFISTLVLPASLDSLGLSSIVLNKLQTLRFLGMTPPKCAVEDNGAGMPARVRTATAVALNPWTAADSATPADIEIEFPEGCRDAYKNCIGIGDYFASLVNSETPTGMEEMQDADVHAGNEGRAIKVLLGGRVLILRDGRFYTMLGAPVEL